MVLNDLGISEGLIWEMSKEHQPEPLDFFIWTVEVLYFCVYDSNVLGLLFTSRSCLILLWDFGFSGDRIWDA